MEVTLACKNTILLRRVSNTTTSTYNEHVNCYGFIIGYYHNRTHTLRNGKERDL